MCRSGRRLRISLCSACELQQLLSPDQCKRNTQKQISAGSLPRGLYTAGHLLQEAQRFECSWWRRRKPISPPTVMHCAALLLVWLQHKRPGYHSVIHQTLAWGCGSCVLSVAHKDPLLGKIVGRENIIDTPVEEQELDGWPFFIKRQKLFECQPLSTSAAWTGRIAETKWHGKSCQHTHVYQYNCISRKESAPPEGACVRQARSTMSELSAW